ncbi:hypothetical protein ACFLUZ_02380 [Chloroflexota bacterium]
MIMSRYELIKGKGRTRISLSAHYMGDDLVVYICNNNAHLGAVALGEYDHREKRASTSVITRLGHKDDAIAYQAAYLVSKATKRPACVIAGVHLPNITEQEIDELMENARILVNEFIQTLLTA